MIGTITDYTVRITGTLWKETHCCSCGAIYFYQMTRTTTGSGDTYASRSKEEAQRAAQERAHQRLRDLLETDFELVPCPTCGSYQPNMCEELRERKCEKIRKRKGIFIAASCLSGIAAAVAYDSRFGKELQLQVWLIPFLCLAVLLLAAGLFTHYSYLAQKRRYNPNEEPLEKRLRIARRRAVSPEELKQRLEAEQNPESPQNAPKPWQSGRKPGAT